MSPYQLVTTSTPPTPSTIMFNVPSPVGRAMINPSCSQGAGPIVAYNGRLFTFMKMMYYIFHNARRYFISDHDKDMTYEKFLLLYAGGDDECRNPPVDISNLFITTFQCPKYNEMNVHIRCFMYNSIARIKKFGCNKRTRRKIDEWVNVATSKQDKVTRLIILLVPDYHEYTNTRSSLRCSMINRPMISYLSRIRARHGLTVELLHLTHVEHMYRMRDEYSSCVWIQDMSKTPDENAMLLTQDPCVVDKDIEWCDDVMVAGDVIRQLVMPSEYHLQQPYNHFPKIKENDWMARIFGARKGDIIRFMGGSETAGKRCFYRHVV